MTLWWLTNFVRLGTEKVAVERLAVDEGWFTLTRWRINEFRFSAEGVIAANGIDYPVRLIYPDQFPSVPAWVEPQDPEAKWSRHQYGSGGSLCLELRPDNWSPNASGADVLRSAHNLLREENPLGDGEHGSVTSAHQIGEVQRYDWGQEPVLIGSGCLERLRTGEAENTRALRWLAEDKVWPILVFDEIDSARPQHPPSFDFGTLRMELPVAVVRIEAPDSVPTDRAMLGEALGISLDADTLTGALVAIAVGKESVTPYHSPDVTSVFMRKWVVLPDDTGLRSGRTAVACGKRVGIVGLGSVGSKVAEILLRSGVHNLLLIDGDVFLPGNLERHILDWRDVGFRKANAVERRLLNITPGATIGTIPINLNWQRSTRTHADQVERLAACDLIVDATGDIPSALLLGAIAFENNKPFVSTEVFEGGIGCLIARFIPGQDNSYVAARMAYNAFCEQEGVEPPPSGRREYEAFTEAGEPVVADDAAVSIAAAHAGRIVLDVLDEVVTAVDPAWLLIGFRKGWLFKRHGHAISLDVGFPPPSPDAVEDGDEEATRFALDLAREAFSATSSSE